MKNTSRLGLSSPIPITEMQRPHFQICVQIFIHNQDHLMIVFER